MSKFRRLRSQIAGSGLIDPYSHFLIAMQTGKVLQCIGGFDYEPVPKIKRDKNWEIPSYDFGHLLDPEHADYLGDRIAEIKDEVIHDLGDVTVDDLRANGQNLGEGLSGDKIGSVYGIKGHVLDGERAFILYRDGDRHIVTYRPQAPVTLNGIETATVRCEAYCLFEYTTEGARWVLVLNDSEWVREIASVANALLGNPKIAFEMAPHSSATVKLAERQRMRARRQVPPTQIVRLTKLEKIDPFAGEARPHQGGTHRSPIPHDRAPGGYSRTYKRTGLTKWYPGPIKVKGGSEAAGAVRYEVRP